jgi:dynein light intermediate chain
MTPGTNSLVKYANAVLVSTSGKGGKKEKGGRDGTKTGNTHTEDILNSILPPREYTMDKQ